MTDDSYSFEDVVAGIAQGFAVLTANLLHAKAIDPEAFRASLGSIVAQGGARGMFADIMLGVTDQIAPAAQAGDNPSGEDG